MRTDPVRILSYRADMFNPQANEVLVHHRQQELLETARRVRLVRQVRQTRPRQLRTRAGWWLVQAGIRMVLSANPSPSAPRPTVAASPQ
jgi:hypothetical protein